MAKHRDKPTGDPAENGLLHRPLLKDIQIMKRFMVLTYRIHRAYFLLAFF
jgi:hypothetical protein